LFCGDALLLASHVAKLTIHASWIGAIGASH
jgi:hypothetical protein